MIIVHRKKKREERSLSFPFFEIFRREKGRDPGKQRISVSWKAEAVQGTG